MESCAKLTLPFTFSGLRGQNIVEASLARSKPSVLEFWKYQPHQGGCDGPMRAGVFGCLDGSLFVFHSFRSKNGVTASPSSERKRPGRTLRPLDLSRALSRSASPSLMSPPFHISTRSRVVSGITPEQVEAPKVYVDFEDEADRLKSLLEGKAPKDRSFGVDNDVTRTPPDLGSTPNSEIPSLKGKEHSKTAISTGTTLPSPSTISGSTQDTLPFEGQELQLIAHIVPNSSVIGHAVRAVVPLYDGKLFVTLRESGDVRVYSTQDGACMACAHTDDIPLQPPSGIDDRGQYHDTCTWHNLKVLEFDTTLVIASAAINPNVHSFDPEDDEFGGRSRIAIFELLMKEHSTSPIDLVKMLQWSYNGPVGGIEMSNVHDDVMELICASHDGTISSRGLKRSTGTSPTGSKTPDPATGSAHALPLPNPFKAMKTHNSEKSQASDVDHGSVAWRAADEGLILGMLHLGEPVLGVRMRHEADQIMGLAWSHSCIEGFALRGHTFQLLFRQALQRFVALNWIDASFYFAIYDHRIECYKVPAVRDGDFQTSIQPSHQSTLIIDSFDVLTIRSPYEAIYSKISEDGRRQFIHFFKSGDKVDEVGKDDQHVLWEVCTPDTEIPLPTSLLLLDSDTVVRGYADGLIRQSNLSRLCYQFKDKPIPHKTSDSHIDGEITSLHVVQNPRTRERFIISGSDDGSIAFWTTTLKICARWTLFTTQLCHVIQLPVERTGPLCGCLLCVAEDGTIAVIALDDFQYMYMIPGSAVPLRRICLSETNLLLIYEDRRARLWDTYSREFWRSLSLDKAEELLPQGGWTELFLDRHDDGHSASLRMISDDCRSPDAVSTLILDVERFISDATTIMKTISTNKYQTKAIFAKLDQIRLILSFLLTPGLNDDIDDICRTRLRIPSSSVYIGFSSRETSTLYVCKSNRDAWRISDNVSAARVVTIVTVLRALGLFEEYMDGAKIVATFYTASLTSSVGPGYQSPNLSFLASLWFKSPELRQSSRTVFDATVVKLSDDEAGVLVDQWRHRLPSLHTHAKESSSCSLALYLCGYLAVEKYSVVSADVLREVSRSVALYLQEENPLRKVLAIDLCSRGFHVWQHYVDTMQILRSLFNLATNSRKDSISIQNVAAQARTAVIHIASSTTPLFMTTLGLDILNPPSVEHRRSVLQILALLIRKRPIVLYSSLSRLMEAVVKSLDPNSIIHRDAILDTATEIIAQVVKTFPNVDFHGSSQRLVVGSSEGAIVMYDLKTATRLYVLEGHKQRITSCSFSPDGRRLVTVSIDEGLVNVWKVGSSFASFFSPGAPPRQGHSGSEPYKGLNFHFGDISQLSESLDSTKFEWVADRNVKVMIGPNTLIFRHCNFFGVNRPIHGCCWKRWAT
ncbi:hypothetical protein APHAL10511_002647 [Amanita phalloides]|nr:hypothetical protein APHAL10511_002647 [Amanita phalloides]